jgi:hypothetical protein
MVIAWEYTGEAATGDQEMSPAMNCRRLFIERLEELIGRPSNTLILSRMRYNPRTIPLSESEAA